MTTFAFGNPQNTQTPFGGFSFGATTSTTTPAMGAQSTGIGTNPLGAGTPFGGLAATSTTTANLFGTTQTAPSFSSSLFPTSTTTTSAFPSLGAATTSASSFNFGGFNTTAPSGSFGFGSNTSFIPTTTATTTSTATVGLGGVDIQSSTGLSGVSTSNKKDSKAVKESQIPDELLVTVESFKKYVKEQKAIREEMSRVSSKNIFRVQEQVNSLKQQLSVVSNGLQRNAVAIAKLKEESRCELKNADFALMRTPSLQYEADSSADSSAVYFENLANNFEKQMQVYRQEIEQLERHLVSLSQPYSLTPNEWIAIRRRLHDTFVTLAAQLQTVHQEIQGYKENFINQQKARHVDLKNFFSNRNDKRDSLSSSHLPTNVVYGPSPFASEQSAVGKAAISNAFNRSQQLPGFTGGNIPSTFNVNRVSSFQSPTTFKPLGQTGVPSFSSSSLGDTTGFSSDSSAQSQFALNSQKPFQLQKPPVGNKRGKRYTST